ncbi:2-dehydro-3-deoxy-D-gluconate 5-dehydrogenase [Planctomycetes bacterium CA13]|uniref:2-dehydro-3-deoxy-D-gluconate 5-dehydrogenase n=1 Tax=Novipirellula herctigrandis TaxID=2527986 RepID=A0A5C5Z2I9_9BACT|nr:2-dehydro-3-deoxy-D-gluconate 5-dehydrogenase [Planctomycetes bacterium CA13]
MTPFELNNRLAVITGGATGIGLGIAQSFIAAGARVVLCSRSEQTLAKASQQLGPQAAYRVHDVSESGTSESLVSEIEENIAPISFLINNAGVHLKKPSVNVTREETQKVLDVHVLGALELTTSVGQRMLDRGDGSVVFIASMTSLIGLPQVVAYSAAKSAYLGMTRTLASEWGPRGVRVNAIAPGWIDSQMMRKALASDPKREEKILQRTPLGGFGQPEDIGWATLFLCSPAARFVTGVCLPVDGGASIGF